MPRRDKPNSWTSKSRQARAKIRVVSEGIQEALAQLAGASDTQSSVTSYHRMLDAVGHNHSGTLHRSALLAIDDLLDIACTGQAWSADAALDVLIDLTTGFDLSLELARDDEDVGRFKRSLIDAVATRRAQITQLAASAADQGTRKRAAELVEALSDDDGPDL